MYLPVTLAVTVVRYRRSGSVMSWQQNCVLPARARTLRISLSTGFASKCYVIRIYY